MDTLAYAELFQAEAGEYMQVLNRCLLSLEKEPGNRENLQEAFRAVHSLKGMAGAMGYRQVMDIAHGLESFLEDFKEDLFEPSAAVLDLVFEAVDLLQLSLNAPEETLPGQQQKIERLLAGIKDFQQANPDPSGSLEPSRGRELESIIGEMERELMRQSRHKGHTPLLIQVSLRDDALMKSVRCYMVLRALDEKGEVVFTVPSRQELEDEKFDTSFIVGFACRNEIRPEKLENMLLKISDLERVKVTSWQETCFELPTESDLENPSPVMQCQAQTSKAADKMVRVETQKLDDLLNLVGEMVVARTRIIEVGRGYSEDLDNTIDQFKRVITGLQDTAMKLRMVPIKQVFERFPRMMRDLSREKNKKIRLVISGENTELDRSIINQLADPLVHLLRNAADHGIESPAVRLAAGKNESGTVLLKAHHEGNQIVITVEDDGAGIDAAIVLKKALAKGIITAEEAARMKEEVAVQLIFQSGFSTCDEITDISGRGVGMDVVKKSIEALHGAIEVSSTPGQKTSFVLRLPLTMAIIRSLMVRSNGQIYIIPLEMVRNNTYIKRSDLKTIGGSPVVNLRGEVIPLYGLGDLLGFTGKKEETGELSVVIVEAGGKTSGLIVDELIGQQEIMIKSIGGHFRRLKGIAGATILGDGSVSLIVDVAGLLENGRDFS